MLPPEYDDDYRTCVETYATLRIYSNDFDPEAITLVMGVEPTKSFRKGEVRTTHPAAKHPNYQMHGWFYSTEGLIDSRDCRRHLDMLLAGPLKNASVTDTLRQKGCWMDIRVFYVYTGGGPTISPHQMSKLAEANIDVWWDLYRDSEDSV